jgi:hypothetical protein
MHTGGQAVRSLDQIHARADQFTGHPVRDTHRFFKLMQRYKRL